MYGFSVHTGVDEDGFIHRQSVMLGNVHDSQERNLNGLNGSVSTALQIGQATEQEAFTTVNIGVGYTFGDGKYRVEGYGQNIADEEASLSEIGGSGVDVRFLNDTRTYDVRAVALF